MPPVESLPPPAPPVSTPDSTPEPAPAPSLTGYAKIYQDELAKIRPKFEAAEQAAASDLVRRRAEFGALRERMAAPPGPPAAPSIPEPPVPPPMHDQPFLDVTPEEPWSATLQKLLFGMGLIGQMAVGIKGGFPEGALAAYTGALRGWQQGDHLRAGQAWTTYLGHVQAYDRAVRGTQQQFENAMTRYGHDQERLKTEFGLLAAEQGLAREGIELGFREPDRLLGQLTTGVKIMEQMQRDADNLAFRNLMGLHTIQKDREMSDLRRAQAEETKRHNLATEARAAAQQAEKQQKVSESAVKHQRKMDVMDNFIRQWEATIEKIDQKKLLPQDAGPFEKKRATTARGQGLVDVPFYSVPNDPDFRAFQEQLGNMIGFARSVQDDIGPRAMAAFTQALRVIEDPPTKEGLALIIKNMREQIAISRQAGPHRPTEITGEPERVPD